MGIQFSGLSSGLPINEIITKLMAVEHQPIDRLSFRKDSISAKLSQYSAVASRMGSLRDALTKLTDAKLGSTFDVFESKLATSSNEGALKATVDNTSTVGSFSVDVLRLATATRAASLNPVGQLTTGASALSTVSEGAIKSGSFTMYVNNVATTINVDASVDTVQNVLDRISTATGGATSVDPMDGRINLTYAVGTSVQFGANGDTSNFANVMYLNTGFGSAGTFTAQNGTSTMDRDGQLIGNTVGFQNNTIAAGTFTLGGASFTIDATTTLSGLMSQVNSSNAGVMMSINTTTNKIEVTSKTTGNQAITMNDNGTGFLQSIGLVNGADSLSSQTMGLNAQVRINGGGILESTSNAVDSTTTGLTGVILNLTAQTTAPATIDVKQDQDKLKATVSDFITKFNAAISFMDEQTKKDAMLQGESAITRLRTDLRTIVTDSVSGLTTYSTFGQVGISTGNVNAAPSAGTAPSSSLILDESKLMAALADNPTEVKKLFIGDTATGVEGVINKLETKVKGAMDPEFGIFSSRTNSANAQLKTINDAIKRGEDRLAVREKQLRAQFNAMEQLISQLQSQQSAISNIGKW